MTADATRTRTSSAAAERHRPDPPAAPLGRAAAARDRRRGARGRQRVARGHGRREVPAVRRAGPGDLRHRPVCRPSRPGPRRPAHRSDPAPDGRDARRDLGAADGAAAAGPRPADVLRHHARARPGPARVAAHLSVRHDHAGDRGALGQLAAPLQVHLGRRRGRAPAADLRAGHRDQRPAADHPARAVQRAADRAA